MSWIDRPLAWISAFFAQPELTDGADIDEELTFHLRALVEENITKGLSNDDAWEQAQRRFGSLRRYADQCRQVTLPGRIVTWVPTAGAAVLAVIAIGLLWQLSALRNQYRIATVERDAAQSMARAASGVLAAQARRNEPTEPPTYSDLAGNVHDFSDQPIPAAQVLVIRKTWPGGRYRQESFDTRTDAEGNFRVAGFVPSNGQYAVQVAAVKDGYATASTYQLFNANESRPGEPMALRMTGAVSIMLTVRDGKGQPVPHARVFPAARTTPGGEAHMVYFQSGEPIQVVADEAGRVALKCFERGDEARIYVQLPGADWEQFSVSIPRDGDEIVITSPDSDEGPPPGSA